MIRALRESGRLGMTVFLFLASVYCVMLSGFRLLYTGTHGYLFLIWNLFLAFLPWVITSLAALRNVRSRAVILIIIAVWLLFFPNCLYILTDLVHLRRIVNAPLWLDLIILLSFAWTGLCYGFISLMDIEYFLKERFNAGTRLVAVLSALMIYVAAFGIYVGRFWRWNSWDVLGNPAELMRDVFGRFSDGGRGFRVLGFTILMGTLLNFMYFPVRYLRRQPTA